MNLVMDKSGKVYGLLIVTVVVSLALLLISLTLSQFRSQLLPVSYLILIQILAYLTYFQFRKAVTAPPGSILRIEPSEVSPSELRLSDILLKEFDYIKETAAQAMNDRHTMVNYFLIITGVVTTLLGGLLVKDVSLASHQKNEIAQALALIFNFIGWLYFMQLVRLRQAWCSSAEAMNQIKEFYITNCGIFDEAARSAFLWRVDSIPAPGKKSNVFYYSAILISLISSAILTFASLISFVPGASKAGHYFSGGLGLYHFLFQVIMYSVFLDYKMEQNNESENKAG
ncbi:MAG: hypothetical protein ONB05_00020 [candidate division KSB1 bacterium]|nr:hypothetical protein [candidate division KSB1 bacterium]